MTDTERLNYLETLCEIGIIAFDPDLPGEMTLAWGKRHGLPIRSAIDQHAERIRERLNDFKPH